MYRLFEQDRPLSQGVLRFWRQIFLILIAITALIWASMSIINIFSGSPLIGLLQLTGGLALLIGFAIGTLALLEVLNAQHRLNDRMTILGEDLRRREASAAAKKSKKRVSANKLPPKIQPDPTEATS